jgi:hypothetical protein
MSTRECDFCADQKETTRAIQNKCGHPSFGCFDCISLLEEGDCNICGDCMSKSAQTILLVMDVLNACENVQISKDAVRYLYRRYVGAVKE